MNFFDLTAVRVRGTPRPRDDEHGERTTFEVEVPDGWQQGAGAFGGWVLAVLVRAGLATAPGRTLRSLTAEIPAPVKVGPATIIVEVLRSGQSVTVVSARLVQSQELAAHAVATFAAPRAVEKSLDHLDLTPPAAKSYRDVEPVPADMPLLPTFGRHFEYWLLDGLPFQGTLGPTTGWIRVREPGPVKDAALVVAHVDAWWPAEYRRLDKPRHMVTLAFTMQVAGGAEVWTTDAPLLHTSRTLFAREGYVTEVRELWTESGDLVALNEQTMVIVK